MDRFRDPAELIGVLGDWSARPGPIYRRLVDAIRAAVDSGRLSVGERLPSERDLSKALSVSRATVVAAYGALRNESVVDSHSGSGTRIASKEVSEPRATPPRVITTPGDVILLAQATDPGTQLIADELAKLVHEGLPEVLQGNGIRLREVIAERYTASGLPTDPAQIVVTSGATQAIALVTELLVPRGATIIAETPTWPGAVDRFRYAGARIVSVPLDDEGIRIDLLARALAHHRPELLYVTPTFHHPSGVCMSSPRRRQVAEIAARHGVTILEDSAEPDPEPLAGYATGPVLTTGSLSKVVWGGLRVGWLRAPVNTAARIARLKMLADTGTPLLDQALAERLLPQVDALAAERTKLLAERLAFLEHALAEQLPEWRWRRPDGGSSLWIELPGTDARVFAEAALRHGVEVAPGSAADPSGVHDSFVRVAYAYPREVLVEMVRRLRESWLVVRR